MERFSTDLPEPAWNGALNPHAKMQAMMTNDPSQMSPRTWYCMYFCQPVLQNCVRCHDRTWFFSAQFSRFCVRCSVFPHAMCAFCVRNTHICPYAECASCVRSFFRPHAECTFCVRSCFRFVRKFAVRSLRTLHTKLVFLNR
jgi:hypothetical protein